ncbi:MAG: prolyl oligopeptidase family serine peptidase [Bacteroidales bacterium]|nr:prolyl oligopeptidase family serine peptidase [Bacteroidales bacterium]
MIKYRLLLAFTGWFLFLVAEATPQEKRPISHSDYDQWKQIENYSISNDGIRVAYEINPQEGDGWLYFKTLNELSLDSLPRGSKAEFSSASNFAVYTIKTPFDTLRKAKLDKVKKDKLPKDSLGITVFDKVDIFKFANLKSFQLPADDSDWVAVLTETVITKPIQDSAYTDSVATQKKPRSKSKKADKLGSLTILNPVRGDSAVFQRVKHYQISDNGKVCVFVQQFDDAVDSVQVSAFFTDDNKAKVLYSAKGSIAHLATDKTGHQMAFTHSVDTTKTKSFSLFYVNLMKEKLIEATGESFTRLDSGWAVSEYRNPWFNKAGSELYFGTSPKPIAPPKDTLTEDEKVSLDIWNWKDDRLQSQQLKALDGDKKRSYIAVYHPKSDQVIQLATTSIPVINIDNQATGTLSLAFDHQPYRWFSSWDNGNYRDVYLIDRQTGARRKIISKASSVVSLDPAQGSVVWFNQQDSSWNAYLIDENQQVNLTRKLEVAFFDEKNDVPNEASPYGMAGWVEDGRCVVYDAYDLWLLDPKGKKAAYCLTRGEGRDTKTRYRYITLDKEQQTLPGQLLLSVFNTRTKDAGFASAGLFENGAPKTMVLESCRFSTPMKSKHRNQLIWRKERFDVYPDLYTSTLDFTRMEQLTFVNAEQRTFAWGSVDLVNWMTFNGDSAQGLLYYPADFDSTKTYPMLVYFYEKYTDELNRYYMPKPIRSVINFSYYTSNGYFIFIPDIDYNDGFPGQSAYDYVVSGTQALVNEHSFINRSKLGIQGQSWGGYQTAWLITRTNMFTAAMAGAPVSNMTSAYGGIRWESGVSRAFQYEQGQSRIGGSLWQKRDLYIENSPLFFADRVETPLLIMHNDADGAVPWYQGIEFFSALRRLQKPVWMLVYNNAPHNLKRRADCKDLTVRMQQYFDFYLKDAPEPEWMKTGVPALEKGINTGLELVE